MDDPTTPAVCEGTGAVAVLVRVVALLDLACREGLHASREPQSYQRTCLTADAQILCYAAVDLLPGGLFPDINRPPVTGTPPLDLIKEAGRLANAMPVDPSPPGMGRLAARITDVIGDLS